MHISSLPSIDIRITSSRLPNVSIFDPGVKHTKYSPTCIIGSYSGLT